MKKLLLSLISLMVAVGLFAQYNSIDDSKYQCSRRVDFETKNMVFGQYSWQSDYLFDYDVKFYFIDIEVQNNSIYIDGNTTVKAEALTDIDTFAIELIPEQTITQIFVNGDEYTQFTRDGNNVLVPVTTIPEGTVFDAQIYYNGEPSTGGFFAGVSTDYSAGWQKDVTWSLSEPFAASDWFAVKQDLEDKADSVWVFLTTDTANMAVSQGLLTNVENLGNGKARYEWKSDYPIDYYLISFAVAEYEEYNVYAHPEELENDSILVQNFVYNTPGCLENYKDGIDATPSMIELFSDLYILYPFWEEKYGHALTQLGGGMEHQTITTIGGFTFDLVSHELGHMWFGDNVTCETWSDIWINEGFATYSNYLAREFLQGASSASSFMSSTHNSAMSQPGGSVYIPEDEVYPGNEWRIFSGRLSYDKGCGIVHTLRHEIQDDDLFFDVLGVFQDEYTNSTATGEEFKETAEQVTGMDFNDFFDQWYYGEGYPIYDLEYYNLNGTFYLTSMQSGSSTTPYFDMLLEMRLFFEDGSDTLIMYRQTDNVTTFNEYYGANVVFIDVDPYNWTMERVNSISVGVGEKQNLVSFALGNDQVNGSVILYFNDFNTLTKDISIVDLSGKTVFEGQTSQNEYHINTSGLSKGVYMVTSTDGREKFVHKFVR